MHLVLHNLVSACSLASCIPTIRAKGGTYILKTLLFAFRRWDICIWFQFIVLGSRLLKLSDHAKWEMQKPKYSSVLCYQWIKSKVICLCSICITLILKEKSLSEKGMFSVLKTVELPRLFVPRPVELVCFSSGAGVYDPPKYEPIFSIVLLRPPRLSAEQLLYFTRHKCTNILHSFVIFELKK